MEKRKPLVSVVISCYNNAETIRESLKSLLNQNYPNYEVILVNDGSTDNTLEIINEIISGKSNIKIISYEKNKGVAVARNVGIKSSNGDIIVFSDADCIFERDWMKKLVNKFNDGVGSVGGPDQCPSDSDWINHSIDYAMTSFIGTGGLRRGEKSLGKYHPKGCNFGITREAIEKVGIFDKRLTRYRGEENELNFRIENAGFNINYSPEALVWHKRRATFKKFWKQSFESGRARIKLNRIQPQMLEPVHLVLTAFVLFMLFFPLVMVVYNQALLIYDFVAGLYFGLIILSGIKKVLSSGQILTLVGVPIAVLILHFGYGLGTTYEYLREKFKNH